ncbi:MAG: methyltransferase domain-containing protein [Ignavibacteriaceae bacterium]|nr:methyltransferase domain-containing protein [Ignavibacteriaceae bacterium]
MIEKLIHSAYEEMAEKFDELIEIKPHNAFYDRPNTLSLLPDVKGKKILDAGCGPGKYAEILSEKGALVTGIDFSAKMIDRAKKRNNGKGEFLVHDLAKPLDMFNSNSFDIVISALTLSYIRDWNPVILEFYRVLKPKGIIVISVDHPFFDYDFFGADNYFKSENVRCVWRGFGKPIEVNHFRRPLSEYTDPFTDNGFLIEKILEPKPTSEFRDADPRHYKELNKFPSFICIRAIKKD